MSSADVPKIALFKLIVLFIIVILSLIIFSELLNIPFQDSTAWYILCWGVINTFFVVWLFFFRGWKISKKAAKQKIKEFKSQPVFAKIFLFIDLILNALCLTFFVYVGAAYLTLFFAKTAFTEKRQVVSITCKESIGGRYSPLPSFTTIEFLNLATNEKMTLTFRGNICEEAPAITQYLPGKVVTLKGRVWFFGKFYDKIDRPF